MITVEILNRDRLVAHVDAMPVKMVDATAQSITRLLLRLTRKVKEEKLSGQVLKNRTGNLRRSIHPDPVVIGADSVSGVVGTICEYARPWEYGFDGNVTVKQHMRMMVQAWGRPVKNPHEISVRSHSRHVVMPEKSFLRSSLKEMGQEITDTLQRDISKALKS